MPLAMAFPDNLCVIDLVHSVHIPCSIQLTDANPDANQNTRKLGPGLLLPIETTVHF